MHVGNRYETWIRERKINDEAFGEWKCLLDLELKIILIEKFLMDKMVIKLIFVYNFYQYLV